VPLRSTQTGASTCLRGRFLRKLHNRFHMPKFLDILQAYFRKTPNWGLATIAQRCAILFRLLFNHPVSSFKVFRALTGSDIVPLAIKDPIIFLKFSFPIYANGLSTADRAAAFAGHYEFLQRCLNREFLEQIIKAQATLWEAEMEGRNFGIYLGIAAPTYGEGELSLNFRSSATDLWILSFVIARTRPLGPDADLSIFVTRLQSKKDYPDLIKMATSSIGNVRPRLLLMAALQGFALGLNIKHIFAVCAKEQVCSTSPPAPYFVSAYDEFWLSMNGKHLPSGWFYLSVPLPETPLALIKQNHRPRVRTRRAFRYAISEAVRERIENVRVV